MRKLVVNSKCVNHWIIFLLLHRLVASRVRVRQNPNIKCKIVSNVGLSHLWLEILKYCALTIDCMNAFVATDVVKCECAYACMNGEARRAEKNKQKICTWRVHAYEREKNTLDQNRNTQNQNNQDEPKQKQKNPIVNPYPTPKTTQKCSILLTYLALWLNQFQWIKVSTRLGTFWQTPRLTHEYAFLDMRWFIRLKIT